MNESIFSHFGEHVVIFFGGSAVWAAIGYAVQTFPTPKSRFWQWLLGVVQYLVGQHLAASNTMKGLDTVRGAAPQELRGTGASIVIPVPPGPGVQK